MVVKLKTDGEIMQKEVSMNNKRERNLRAFLMARREKRSCQAATSKWGSIQGELLTMRLRL